MALQKSEKGKIPRNAPYPREKCGNRAKLKSACDRLQVRGIGFESKKVSCVQLKVKQKFRGLVKSFERGAIIFPILKG
jgi:hypothetical protein